LFTQDNFIGSDDTVTEESTLIGIPTTYNIVKNKVENFFVKKIVKREVDQGKISNYIKNF